jgi:hypothetical protein
MVEDLEEDETPVTLHEDRVIEKAKEFVNAVERHFPYLRRVFEKVRIPPDDVIAQALCCEVVLEVYHIPKISDVLKKARISVLPKRSKKRKEPKGEEAKENESNSQPKKFIHDGKLLFAVVQLTIKLYHPNSRRQKRKIKWKVTKLAERIWK